MDAIDKKILNELSENARMPNTELARRVGISQAHCLRRVGKLEQENVITGYKAELNMQQVGFKVSVLLFIRLTRNGSSNSRVFEKAISEMDEIQECLTLTGKYDYMLRAISLDLADYKKLEKDKLAKISVIETLESSIVLSEFGLPGRFLFSH